MQSSQGQRSICSCIIGIGRKSRPIRRIGNQDFEASCYWFNERNSTRTPARQVSYLSSKLRQSRNAQALHKRKSNSLLHLSTPLSYLDLGAINNRSSPSQHLRRISFSTVAAPTDKPSLSESGWRNPPSHVLHQGIHQSLCPRVLLRLGTRAVSTTARRIGTPGMGGGGGTPTGCSSGTLNTNSSQFTNLSRNIFGQGDG